MRPRKLADAARIGRVIVSGDVLGGLKLQRAAGALGRHLDHLPSLISDACLVGASRTVSRYVRAVFESGTTPASETLTMPRRGFGPRPVTILDPPSRVLYAGLVDSLESVLPEPTRSKGGWDRHRRFGLDQSEGYVVELDIASCYEFIDHEILGSELLLRSLDSARVRSVVELLGSWLPHGRGLPQMLRQSDLLADAYLSVLDRRLARDDLNISRYADDIRVIVDSWEDANAVIEKAAEYVRDLGLILSSSKTRIFKVRRLIEAQNEDAEFLNRYIAAAASDLDSIFSQDFSEYRTDDDEAEDEEEEPQADLIADAAWRILHEWQLMRTRTTTDASVPGAMSRFIGPALLLLVDYPEQLSPKLLQDIAFREPQRLEQVCLYLVGRASRLRSQAEDLWAGFRALAMMGRQSPWAKVWLLRAAEELTDQETSARSASIDWMLAQATDRHEVVRAQAAWTLAQRGLLGPELLRTMYVRASSLTQPGLAAAAAAAGATIPSAVLTAIRDDSPLNKAAVGSVAV